MSTGFREYGDSSMLNPSAGSASGVLVVDDDPAFQLGLKTFLREYAGFETVFTARSGYEALNLIDSEPSITVVTLDNEMPGMSGIDFLERLTDSHEDALSVVMITGKSSKDLEDKFRSYRSDKLLTNHYLSKPVSFEELEPIILRANEELHEARDKARQGLFGGDAEGEDLEELSPKTDDTAAILPFSGTPADRVVQEAGEQNPIIFPPAVDSEAEEAEDAEEGLFSSPEDEAEPAEDTTPANVSSAGELKALEAKVDENSEILRDLQSRIPTLEQRFWLSVIKIGVLFFLVWVAWQAGVPEFTKNKIADWKAKIASSEEGNVPEEEGPEAETKDDKETAPSAGESVPEVKEESDQTEPVSKEEGSPSNPPTAEEAGELWYSGGLVIELSKKSEEEGDSLTALAKTREAISIYDKLAEKYPSYQPEIVQSKLSLLKKKAKELSDIVEKKDEVLRDNPLFPKPDEEEAESDDSQ